MKADVLRLLRENAKGMTAEQIATVLGVSVAAVKTVIRQLVAEGYDIDKEDGAGYRLISYPEVITAAEIMSRVRTQWAGKKVYYRNETESTNEDARELAEEGMEHGALVVAKHQTGGKGRRGRSWECESGNSVAMSLLLHPEFSPEKAPMLTLLTALSVAEVLEKLTEADIKIKWPNDILINRKKVCGILTEMRAEEGVIDHVVVGVGINVNQNGMPEEIAGFATSLLMEMGQRYGRADIMVAIMEYFEGYYDDFLEHLDLSAVVDAYDSYLINRGAQVKVLDPQGEYTGTAQGINDYGELIVQKDDGTFARVSSGEVSVRGIYGYV